MTAESTKDAGVSPARVEAFSDGVLAIAITLLVLDLHAPPTGQHAGSLAHALLSRDQLSSYAAYVVSFLVIGITWLNHHSLFRQIARVDRAVLLLNLLLLLGLAVLPFPTRLMAAYVTAGGADAHTAAFAYSLVMAYVALMFSAIWWYVTREGGRDLRTPMGPAAVRSSRHRFSIGFVFYLVTLGLAFLSAPLTLAVHGALALYYAFEQLRT